MTQEWIMKFNIKEVKKYFKEQGCKLLEEKYINAHIKMKYICSCGNESSINLNKKKKLKLKKYLVINLLN
jgi:hypothetical protein